MWGLQESRDSDPFYLKFMQRSMPFLRMSPSPEVNPTLTFLVFSTWNICKHSAGDTCGTTASTGARPDQTPLAITLGGGGGGGAFLQHKRV